jgi:hypothetical protein
VPENDTFIKARVPLLVAVATNSGLHTSTISGWLNARNGLTWLIVN